MNVLEGIWKKGGPIDRAREAAAAIGARPYRVFLTWSAWSGEEIGDGREGKLLRYEIRPRPVVVGYAGLTRNPAAIGVVPTGSLRATEVPLWLPFDVLRGRCHPERPGLRVDPDRTEFRYEVELADDSTGAARFRLAADPERDVEGMQWILVLERQGAIDR